MDRTEIVFACVTFPGEFFLTQEYLETLNKHIRMIKFVIIWTFDLQTDDDDDEERKKRRREKNKVAAARCRNRKKERTDFLQKVSKIKYYNYTTIFILKFINM